MTFLVFGVASLTLNNTVTLKSGLEVTQGNWNWCHSKVWVRFPIRLLTVQQFAAICKRDFIWQSWSTMLSRLFWLNLAICVSVSRALEMEMFWQFWSCVAYYVSVAVTWHHSDWSAVVYWSSVHVIIICLLCIRYEKKKNATWRG